jgi:hypothetical protein
MSKVNSKAGYLLGSFLVFALFVSVVVSAGIGSPILRATPEDVEWVADGVSQYKIIVDADNRPLGHSWTKGIDFRYYLPSAPGYIFSIVSVNPAPANDFFAGYPTNNFNPSFEIIGRRTQNGLQGPLNRTGSVAEIFFTVSPAWSSAANRQTQFVFDTTPGYTFFTAQDGVTEIYPDVFSVPFIIVNPAPTCPADLDDGSATGTPDHGVDINDLLYFLARFEAGDSAGADLDDGSGTGIHDGGVDINDLLYFLQHFEAGC